MTGGPLENEIEKANAELDQGLKSCRSMLNDYRAALTGEQSADATTLADHKAAEEWRTQEDSNL